MAISPKDLLVTAQELMGQDGEVSHRTAANRAYYAAFHYCNTVANSLPQVDLQGRVSHVQLIRLLKDHEIKEESRDKDVKIRTLGNFLNEAKPLREHADYRISEDFRRTKAERMILIAAKIAEIVSEIGRD